MSRDSPQGSCTTFCVNLKNFFSFPASLRIWLRLHNVLASLKDKQNYARKTNIFTDPQISRDLLIKIRKNAGASHCANYLQRGGFWYPKNYKQMMQFSGTIKGGGKSNFALILGWQIFFFRIFWRVLFLKKKRWNESKAFDASPH